MIAKEALHNALKHADAKQVRVHFTFSQPTLQISIQDDGPTTSLPKSSSGQGLANMQHRAGLFDADLRLQLADPHGLRLTLRTDIPHSQNP